MQQQTKPPLYDKLALQTKSSRKISSRVNKVSSQRPNKNTVCVTCVFYGDNCFFVVQEYGFLLLIT